MQPSHQVIPMQQMVPNDSKRKEIIIEKLSSLKGYAICMLLTYIVLTFISAAYVFVLYMLADGISIAIVAGIGGILAVSLGGTIISAIFAISAKSTLDPATLQKSKLFIYISLTIDILFILFIVGVSVAAKASEGLGFLIVPLVIVLYKIYKIVIPATEIATQIRAYEQQFNTKLATP